MRQLLVGGWATPLKNMKVNWDDDIPNIYGKIKNGNQTTNQIKSEHYTSRPPLYGYWDMMNGTP